MKYLWVYLWTQNKNTEMPGKIFFVFINVTTIEGHFVDTNRDTGKYSDNLLIIQNILIIIIVGTFVGTKLNSVYIISNQTACNSPPKRRESAEFLTKMSQKAPFSLITAAGNSITAKKRGAPGTHGAVGCPRRVRLDKSKIESKPSNSHLYRHK